MFKKNLIAFLILFNSFLYSEEINLKIISTTDIHGAIFPFNFVKNHESSFSLFQVYSYVKKERKNKNQEVLLIDVGDILQGEPIIYYYNFEKPNSKHIVSKVMNFMKYDAAIVGNHDIEAGHEVYDKIVKEFNFPWLSANSLNIKTKKPYFIPYKIFKVKGLKIALLGMITPSLTHHLPEELYSNIRFENMIESAQKWVTIIRKNEKPDLLIGAFHEGVKAYKNPDESECSLGVAHRVRGFDIIFTGHDHENRNFFHTNNFGEKTLVLGSLDGAKFVSKADIKFTRNKKTNNWEKNITGKLISIKGKAPDQELTNTFKNDLLDAKKYLAVKIAENTEYISAKNTLFGSSAFVDLIHKIQLDITKADISFTAPLSLSGVIKKGDIKRRDLFGLYKYENHLLTMKLTGEEIKGFLEHSYSLWFNHMKDENDHLLLFSKDSSGNLLWSDRYNIPLLQTRFYMYDSAAGINYTVDVSKPPGNRVNINSLSSGKKFEMKKFYRVSINSYRGSGAGGHLTKGAKIDKEEIKKRTTSKTKRDIRHYIMNWLEDKKIITPKPLNNWRVIPQKWWEKARKKDYNLLFETQKQK